MRARLYSVLVVIAAAIAIAIAVRVDDATLPAAIIAIVVATLLLVRLIIDRTRVAGLRHVACAYADGDFARRAAISGSDSLARLGHDLNLLGERLVTARGELESQRRLLDGALGALTEGVACIDAMDRVIWANAAWRHLATGGGEATGIAFYEQVPAAALSAAIATARTAGHAGRSGDGIEFEHRRRHLQAAVARADNAVLVAVLHDVTEVKVLEGARREFVAAVSHELKTPLTAIAGFAETLLDGTIEEDSTTARSFVEKIARHAERLTVLVRDVLTLSRLEQGSWTVRPESVDLAELGRSLCDEHMAAAQEKQVRIELECPEQLIAISDRELLHQLLGNLVSNAVRYNRQGGAVRVCLSGSADDGLRLVVQDNGIGIPPEHQERVFDRFYRVDAHRSRQSGGTGLGLAIVKQLVTALHGTIGLVSSPEGTTFTVDLPLRDPRAAVPAAS